VAPADETVFAAAAEIVLQWRPAGTLPEDAYYAINVAYTYLGTPQKDDVPWTRETSWTLSEHQYLRDRADSGRLRWSVQVVRQTGVGADGKPKGVPLSAPSKEWSLIWSTGGVPALPPP
jgi:hypothetical protein